MSWNWWYFGVKTKKTCGPAFSGKITSWLCGVKSKSSVLQGENYEFWISTKSCSVKLSKVPIGLSVVRKFKKPERWEKSTKIWTSAILALGSGKLSEVLIGLVVPKKLEKTERNCPDKNIGDCDFHLNLVTSPTHFWVFWFSISLEDKSEQFFVWMFCNWWSLSNKTKRHLLDRFLIGKSAFAIVASKAICQVLREEYMKVWISAKSCSRKLSEISIRLLVVDKLKKLESICLNKNIGG